MKVKSNIKAGTVKISVSVSSSASASSSNSVSIEYTDAPAAPPV